MKIRLLLIVFSPLALYAQYLPDLKIPKLRPTEYENLQAKTVAQTLSDFQLKGPVRSVCEMADNVYETTNGQRRRFLRTEYQFSEHGNLLSCQDDSASTLFGSYEGIKQITHKYDSTGKILLESIIGMESPWNKSKTVIRYNEQGFKEREEYTCYRYGSDSKSNPADEGIFDYILDYQWTPDFDSVSLKYQYLKPVSPYHREHDAVRSFVGELNRRKKDQSPVTVAEISNLYFPSFQDDIKTDKRKRITEWTIWDHEIKSSINVHQKFEYTYNEQDELTEVRHYSTGRGHPVDDFQLDYTIEISYIAYDQYGNWTEREVFFHSGDKRIYSPYEGIYYFKRNLSYYW